VATRGDETPNKCLRKSVDFSWTETRIYLPLVARFAFQSLRLRNSH
jgi:hypothetical protein